MLREIGVGSMDELIRQTMPEDILSNEAMDLDEPLTEQEHLDSIADMAAKNLPYKSLIGRGWYGTIMPAVIQRNVLENPVWYTSYTPYQAEVSQGRLEALFRAAAPRGEARGLLGDGRRGVPAWTPAGARQGRAFGELNRKLGWTA